MRKVEATLYRRVPANKKLNIHAHHEPYKAICKFHQWGLEDSGDYENGYNITVGIVELENGEIKIVAPENIKFLD